MNWIWKTVDSGTNPDYRHQYEKYSRSNIHGLLFEYDDESHYRAAKECGLEAHRWIWTLNNQDPALPAEHPEWYAVNRNGESCATKRPYVDYYRWLCPNHPEVQEFLKAMVEDIVRKDYIDGIHLDYIRFCDVILPVSLWDKYGLQQNSEQPSFDYCYCENCRSKFRLLKGVDPLDIPYPDQSLSWRKFRYDSITNLVNQLSAVSHAYGKQISAAVFPTPEVARRIVRQDWTNWNLDRVFPMTYHNFYNEDIPWIGDAVEEGVRCLHGHGNIPLFAGLFIPAFNDKDQLSSGIAYALSAGAQGISLFGEVDDEILQMVEIHKLPT